jgi:integrase
MTPLTPPSPDCIVSSDTYQNLGGEGLNMKGGIYWDGKSWKVKYPVRGEKPIQKRFGRNKAKGERFLNALRFKDDEGELDARDYRADNPLGFENLSEAWLDLRKGQVRCFRNLRNHIEKAQNFLGNRNIKLVQYAQLEDFFHALQGQGISSKTVYNVKTTLHAFFVWVKKRYGIKIPEFPEIKVTLGWRNTVDKETQGAILDEIKRISYGFNPRIWLGIKWLSTYYEVRPIELINVKERDINYETGTMAVWYSKTDLPKIIYLLSEDLGVLRSFGPSFGALYVFRHQKGNGPAQRNGQFGPKYLYKWWVKACDNLNIGNVDLYGGTRHSTVRALAANYTPEQIKRGSWQTNKAMERYLGPVDQEQKRKMYRKARGRVIEIEKCSSRTTTTQE